VGPSVVPSNKSQRLSAADLKALRQAVAGLRKPGDNLAPRHTSSGPSYYTR
jgi:hypothetical protein